MNARAIKFSLEAGHVLPRVWRGGRGDRDPEIFDIVPPVMIEIRPFQTIFFEKFLSLD